MKRTLYEWNREQMDNYKNLKGETHKKNGLYCMVCGFELSDSLGHEPDEIEPVRIPVHCESCGFTGYRMAQYVSRNR